jgi:CheY-like chemotaxis protein
VWQLTGDPTQLSQVLMNLAVNARDAMPRGGTLRVALENVVLDELYAEMNSRAKPGRYVRLRVEDTGTGIPPEVIERIFEPFFTTKELGKGTGLGLSTTHAIVQSHGGFINVSSEPGRGTQFAIHLPALDDEAPSATVSEERSTSLRGNGELLLVVDDEPHIRKMVSRVLVHAGYRVLLASQGAEAISLYAQHRGEIAAVLTDLAMPVMDGSTLLVALRSIDPKVRVIGSSGMEPSEEAAALPHFLPKPYTAEALLQTVRATLTASA